MIVVLCFYPGDQDLALKNVRWWNELGGCKGHEVLVAHDPRCIPETTEEIRQELLKCFDKVYKCNAEAQMDGWPEGANYFFRLISTWLQGDPVKWPYFFWMEPDAIPLREGWLDAIVEAHRRSGKPFMGDRVAVGDIPLHMSGVGIYQNPIYLLAGECYRAHDTAWDMAAREQIVPNAAFTDLIEHAWKHPAFHDPGELGTQIAPQTLLFHSSKDGSLIDLLAQKRGGKQSVSASTELPYTKEPDKPGSPSPLPVNQSHGPQFPAGHTAGAARAELIYDIFIRTYHGDYDWLKYCVESIDKFCSGFRKVWIFSPHNPPIWMLERTKYGSTGGVPVDWKLINEECENGYLSQQITKLYADVLTSYQADYYLHVDSDVIFTRPTTPQDFLAGDKVVWYHTAYSQIQTPWQPVIEKFFAGASVPYEFMRRLPMMVPRWLYPRLREGAHHIHGCPVGDYIRRQPNKEFSEFNVLGAYAWMYHKNLIHWVDTASVTLPEPFARQFHSWSGLTLEVKHEIEGILGGTELDSETFPGANSVPSRIKILPNDLWVLEGEQISGWVEECGRLDHDPNLLPRIMDNINEGDTVVDVGAFIGDHAIAYARKAGRVHAFEPNPVAFQCLSHNVPNGNVTRYSVALGNTEGMVPISTRDDGDQSGIFVGDHRKVCEVMMRRLDDYPEIKPDLIKIDVEGGELGVLNGAEQMISKHHPKLVIEIQQDGLARQGVERSEIFRWLEEHGYDWKIILENICESDPLYDILATPKQPAVAVPEFSDGFGLRAEGRMVVPTSPPPVAPPPLSLSETILNLVRQLKEISEESPRQKAMVMQRLAYAGLRHKPKAKKKKK